MSPGSSLVPPTKGQQMQHKCRTNDVWMHAALLFRSTSCILGRGRVPVAAQRVLKRLVPADKTPMVCSPSGFDLPLNPRWRGEERWIAAARPSTSRRRKEETMSHSPFLFASSVFSFCLYFSQFFCRWSVLGRDEGFWTNSWVITDQWQIQERKNDCTYSNTKEGLVFLAALALINVKKILFYIVIFHSNIAR